MGDKVMAFAHTFQSAAVADGNGTAMDVGGLPGVGVQVEGITTATVNFEGTIDESTWYAIQAQDQRSGEIVSTATADGLFVVPCIGLSQIRCRISGYSGGTIIVTGKGVTNAEGGLPARGGLAVKSIAGGAVDANLQVGDADASAANPVPTKGFLARFDVALTLDTNIYAANDLLADTQAVTSVFLNGNPVVLYDVRILDEDDQGQAMDILFVRSNTSLGTENVAYAPTDAMGREILKKVSILAGDFVDEGAFRTAYKSLCDGIGCVLAPTTGTTLYIAAVCRSGTPTYTAAGVRAQFGVVQAG